MEINNNPIMFVDPTGLIPSLEAAAAMAKHIYDYDQYSPIEDRIVRGWRLIDVWDGGEGTSIKLGIYIPNEDDWQNPSEYALVFRGSTLNFFEAETWNVWANNALAYMTGLSEDMKAAIRTALYFDETHSHQVLY